MRRYISILWRNPSLSNLRYLSTKAQPQGLPATLPIVRKHQVKNSEFDASMPFIENYRPRWPAPELFLSQEEINIPKRTVPDEVLKFEMTATMAHGQAIRYPHMEFNPADFKVILYASIDKLGLLEDEKKIFCEMVGKRFRSGRREVRLITSKFTNRIENKRYLIYLLETLIAETKKIYAEAIAPPAES